MGMIERILRPALFVFIAAAILYLCSGRAYAANEGNCGDNVKWKVTAENGICTLTISGTGNMADYYPNDAPWAFHRVHRVIIEKGVTSIGNNAFCFSAFNYDKDLKRSYFSYIEIPDSVTSIGWKAFNECSGLESIKIPGSVTTINENAFLLCENLKSIEIPESVTSIGPRAFQTCKNLTSIAIPGSVTSIGSGTFFQCENLESIEIPKGVTSIGDSAFCYCSKLSSIAIPGSVTSIGEAAFDKTNILSHVYYPKSENDWITLKENCSNANIRYENLHANTCMVSFYPENGDPPYHITCRTGETVPFSEIPNKTGDTFEGWYTKHNGGGEKYLSSTIINDHINYYAKWKNSSGSPSDDPSDNPSDNPSDDPSDNPADDPSAPKDTEKYLVPDVTGLTLNGDAPDLKIYYPCNTVSFNGRYHVWSGTKLSDKQKKKKSPDLENMKVTGLPDSVSIEYVYGKNKDASEDKAYYYIKLKPDKASDSYRNLDNAEKKMLSKEIKKLNKALKKVNNRVYFPIKPVDLSDFIFDKEKSIEGEQVFVRKGNSADTLTLKRKLEAVIDGYKFVVSKKEYTKTESSDAVTISGKNKNFTGSVTADLNS